MTDFEDAISQCMGLNAELLVFETDVQVTGLLALLNAGKKAILTSPTKPELT
jgi:hypothetical protein